MTTNNLKNLETRRPELWNQTEDEWTYTVENHRSLLYKKKFENLIFKLSKPYLYRLIVILMCTAAISSIYPPFILVGMIILIGFGFTIAPVVRDRALHEAIEKEMNEDSFYEARFLLMCEREKISVDCVKIRNKLCDLVDIMTERNYTEYRELIWCVLPQCFDVKAEDLIHSKLYAYLNKMEKRVTQKYSEVSQVSLLNEYIDLC